ncbi:MAG: SAM-dependent methyltransferase [Chloroflexi bacterium]|nr:SAM-dependent methyltransferase [Chloroflexota bacterium]
MITLTENADNADNPVLRRLIAAEIAQTGGRIPFARFMELALYAPEEGYYTSRVGLIGAKGDFYTAPHLTPAFGQLIARQLAEFWRRLGEPPKFQLVEMGAGQGLLASDILTHFYQQEKELWPGLSYTIVERSKSLQEGQRRRLLAVPDGATLLPKVSWRDLDEFEPGSVVGGCFSNELVDAFPVHLIQLVEGEWREVYVGLNPAGDFEEETGPLSTSSLATYFEAAHLDPTRYEEGYRTEINLAALDWMQQVAQVIAQGYILTIDYGYQAERRYHPRRQTGTLQTYNGHTVGDNPYLNVGHQDITAHIDFTALIKQGEAAGLKTEGFTTQMAFLGGLGIANLLLELSTSTKRPPKEVMAEYNALQRLINPTAMGNFGVLIQSKGVAAATAPLAGLSLSFI